MDFEALLDRCVQELPSGISIPDKVQLLTMLGWTDDRRTYPLLMKALQDERLQEYAIKALAQAKDSRSFFPLVNLFNQTTTPMIHQRILQYMYETRDPRAEEFLRIYLSDTNKPYRDIAEQALKYCAGNADFLYRYAGADESFRHAQSVTGQIVVTKEQLTLNERVLEENQRGSQAQKPQTFIVNNEGVMYIGGLLNEHVEVARGNDVRAAGEVIFIKLGERWGIEYINNRSNSYYPHPSSFVWVKRYLEPLEVHGLKDHYDEVFPRDGFNDVEFLDLFKLTD